MAGNKNSGGHNRKGTQFHVLNGTFRPDRHADQESPEPSRGKPVPPKPLTGEAKAEWDRMVNRLEESKTLTIVDDAALYQYVNLFAETEQVKADAVQARTLSKDLKKMASKLDGTELVEAIGKIVLLHQMIQRTTVQLRQGHMAIRQYLVEFGMTPSARGRVKVPKNKKPDVDRNKERFFGSGQRG